jgi:hypothetical protein
MARAAFEQSISIAAPPTQVRAMLSDFSHHTQLHPMIVAVIQTGTDATRGDEPIRHYQITDRMRLGPLTFRFTYRARIVEQADGTLVSDAYQKPRVHLRNVTCCLLAGSGTRVEERITIEAPRPLIRLVLRQAQAAHQGMLAQLKATLEAQP